MRFPKITFIPLLLALISAVLGGILGAMKLGFPEIPIPPFITDKFLGVHPEVIILGFFNLMVFIERWEARKVFKNRPKWISEFILIPAVLATLFFILNVLFGSIIGFFSIFWRLGWAFTAMAAFLMIFFQSWIFLNHMKLRGSTSYIILASFLLAIVSLLTLYNWTMPRRYVYLVMYLVIIILGERIELAGIEYNKNEISKRLLILFWSVGLIYLMLALSDLLFIIESLFQLSVLTLAIITFLLVKYDVGLYSKPNEPFIGFYQRWSLRGGYFWLLIGLILFLANSYYPSLQFKDSALHSVTIGFVLTMVLSHAPLIFPGLLQKPPIQKLRGGVIWIVLLWIFLSFRVIGNLSLYIGVDFSLLTNFSGYLTLISIIGFGLTMIEALTKKSRSFFPWEQEA